MSKRLIIIGASAMGRETFCYATDCLKVSAPGLLWSEIGGFLDTRQRMLDAYCEYPPILGDPETYTPQKDDLFVCALGDAPPRIHYTQLLATRGATFVSIIHPRAYVGKNVKIGDGCILCPGSTITTDTQLGDHVILNVNASISHDCTIGDYCTISPGGTIAGWCSLERSVFLGTQATIIPHVEIVTNTAIGAGAVVTRSIKLSGTYVGVPARWIHM